MRSLRTILAVLLAVAWMPLTAHCAIENVTGFEFLRCAPDEAGGTPCSPCDSGSCCSWESVRYQLPEGQPAVAAPVVAALPEALAAVTEASSPEAAAAVPTVAPPEPPTPWQFSLRTALPPRAPSPVA